MKEKPWVDVCTTSTPVLLTEQCIHSLLVRMVDRFDFKLRWVVHLDQYPLPGLEKYWNENLQQIIKLSAWFDDAIIMASRTNQSYGTSVCRVWKEVRHPLFHCEDDKYWLRDFSLTEIRNKINKENADAYIFYHNIDVGSTTPTFWEQDRINPLRDNAPKETWKITELTWVRLAKKHGIKTIGPTKEELGKQVKRRLYANSYWLDIGKDRLRHLLNDKVKFHPARCWWDRERGIGVKG